MAVDWSKIAAKATSGEELETETPFPKFEDINEVEYNTSPTSGAVNEDAILDEAAAILRDQETTPRRRGRPKGSKNKRPTTRDSKEVAERIEAMLTGGTGILALVRDHFQMTDEEAEDIAKPLSDYLIRQEDNSEVIREFLDKYDIVAAGIAILTYLVRVWRDEVDYRKAASSGERRAPGREDYTIAKEQREQEVQSDGTNGTITGEGGWISTPAIPG